MSHVICTIITGGRSESNALDCSCTHYFNFNILALDLLCDIVPSCSWQNHQFWNQLFISCSVRKEMCFYTGDLCGIDRHTTCVHSTQCWSMPLIPTIQSRWIHQNLSQALRNHGLVCTTCQKAVCDRAQPWECDQEWRASENASLFSSQYTFATKCCHTSPMPY